MRARQLGVVGQAIRDRLDDLIVLDRGQAGETRVLAGASGG
ncbi:MAG: hypothetical protein AAF772_13695 [Acidobacteriota bacterium]